MNAEALIGTVLGTCTLQKLIGQGGMGAVYLAQQSRPKRQVAVKVLLPMTPLSPNQLAAFLERFRRETDAAASLEHPNIMPVHEYGEREGLAYLVMPYISGGTLRDELEREGQLPLDKTVYYLEQMAAAVDVAHEHGVIHRDIKPANILLTPEGRLLLTDFGLVKIIAEGQIPQLRLTGPGAPVGTPDYMAPEQVIGEEVDPRADLYSLGVILYQMVTGTTPFQGDSPMQIAAQHLQVSPPAPRAFRPDLPPAAEQVILRAMAKRPEDRYTRAQDLTNAFRMALVAAGILLDTSTISSLPRMPVSTATGRVFVPKGRLEPDGPPSIFTQSEKNGKHAGPVGPVGRSSIFAQREERLEPAASTFAQSEQDGRREGGLLHGTGILPSVTSNLPAARGGGLLTRTGMMPAMTKNAAPDTENSFAGGGLLSRTGKFPQMLPGSGASSAVLPDLPAAPVTPEGKIATTDTQLAFPEAPKMTVPLANTAATAPLSDQQEAAGTVKLTGPVKVVKVPVAGQPGRYVTGLLPVGQTEESAAGAEPKKRLRPWVKMVAVALIAALIVGGLGSFLLGKMHPATKPAGHNGTPRVVGALNTAADQATATAQANIIVSDPLNQQINNWLTSPPDTFFFKNGAYHITDHGDHGRASILQNHTFDKTPMVYSLTMQEIQGNDNAGNNTFGMIFRFNTKMNGNKQVTTFYSFEVENTNGGYYRFWKYDDTNATGANAWTDLWHSKFGNEFHQGHGPQAVNTFKVAMNGGSFTFIVNGKTVGTAKDASLTGGMVGMAVNLDGTEVAFKNLLVTRN